MSETIEVLVLGGGAAGCMAAIQAGRRGRKVLLFEHAKKIGAKILISGGGRCNFTNRGAKAENYLSENPDFCRSALARFTAKDTEAWFAGAGIPYHEKTLGQLFCDRGAQDVVDLLVREMEEAGVEIRLGVEATSVQGLPKGEARFLVETAEQSFEVQSLVIATGGLSYPALGASDFGLKVARDFGLRVVETAPALDGFVFGPQESREFEGLQGLSLPAVLSCGGKRFAEDLLFTHKGLSGPVALQASLYWRPGEAVQADLWPGDDPAEAMLAFKRENPKMELAAFLSRRWPQRLAERWQALASASGPLARISDPALRELAASLKAFRFIPTGTVGYHKAEVTRGGLDTRELSQKDLQALKVPGLYFCGEVVDVTGELGGYNFQWAWASGAAVGRSI